MMTKYQLVYVRLETQMKKIFQNLDTRRRLRLKRGFQAFRTHNFEHTVCQHALKKRQLVCAKFELTLDVMCGAFERYL